MIPVAFDYELATSAEHALSLLAEHGDDAKVLAGGHSLIPLMKYRLATRSEERRGGKEGRSRWAPHH